MPRSGRLRNFICEYKESPKIEKMSFIPPFFILALEIILIVHAYFVQEVFIIILTSILLIISLIETILVSAEVHQHYTNSNFDRILTIRLDDFITESKQINVKNIVMDFIKQYPEYEVKRNEIYHITCQILETHRKEATEKELILKLTRFIKRKKKANVDEIIESFLKKFPKYKSQRIEIYEKTCQIMDILNNKK
jgi:hypothetical protein